MASLASACHGTEHVVLSTIVAENPPPPASGSGGGDHDAGTRPADAAGTDEPREDAADADVSVPEPDIGLDPNVVFEWSETLPGQGTCGPGRYVGSFTCALESNPIATVVGQMSFELVDADDSVLADESALILANGRMSDLAGLLFSAELIGTLNCVSRRIAIQTIDGRSIGVGELLRQPTFEATLAGDFDAQRLELLGDITIHNDLGEVCRGGFQAGAAL